MKVKAEELSVDEGLRAEVYDGRDFGMDLYVGTCPTAKFRMLPDQHTEFVGFDLGSAVFRAREPDLCFKASLQVKNPTSHDAGHKNVRAAARTLKEKLAVALAEPRLRERRQPGWTRRK